MDDERRKNDFDDLAHAERAERQLPPHQQRGDSPARQNAERACSRFSRQAAHQSEHDVAADDEGAGNPGAGKHLDNESHRRGERPCVRQNKKRCGDRGEQRYRAPCEQREECQPRSLQKRKAAPNGQHAAEHEQRKANACRKAAPVLRDVLGCSDPALRHASSRRSSRNA
ncbi:hypothetical protein CE91St30_25470 [Raoultibacter timonensis]|uniref:Uncharacterized protein n=1 Tax=Raoultibacter timonensis TaxID=1907662 RepID=A0ABM7WLL2_9ACTN|nr:hypothetical protein CE91St30_25470 [Raoultibacter timonensis]BDF51817.1 hypothetical protein CE91St31_25470 [Raoultibacter timonensis]